MRRVFLIGLVWFLILLMMLFFARRVDLWLLPLVGVVCVGLIPLADWGSSDDEMDLLEARSSTTGPDSVSSQPFRGMLLRALLIVHAGADVLIRETPMDVNESPITQHRVILLVNGDHSPNYSRMAGFYISSDAFALIVSVVLP